MTPVTFLFLLLPLAAGCGDAPGVHDAGVPPCDGTSSCPDEGPPESVCLEHLAAYQLDDGCGVFANWSLGGDDANPGTKQKPVQTLPRAVELARVGRGRIFACIDVFRGPSRSPPAWTSSEGSTA
jgi:hypothetical protein